VPRPTEVITELVAFDTPSLQGGPDEQRGQELQLTRTYQLPPAMPLSDLSLERRSLVVVQRGLDA
jgi:hypothetical protein